MDDFRASEERNSLADRMAACSSVACTLGWLFTYPTRETAEEATSPSFIARCCALLEEASEGSAALLGDGFCQCVAKDEGASRRASDLRREHTRLFLVPFSPISLEGSRWVRRRTLASRKLGERYAVEQEYRLMGVARKAGSILPCDHLACELDFVSFLAAAEAQALEEGGMSLARELKQARVRFVRDHLRDPALGVSTRVRELSTNRHMRFHARLLEAFIASIDPERAGGMVE